MTTRLRWASLSFAALATTSLGAAVLFISGHFQTRSADVIFDYSNRIGDFADAAEFSTTGLPINSHPNWFNFANHIPGGQSMFAAKGALAGSTLWRETRSAMSGRTSLGQTRGRPESTLLL
jgi:hypothetical protein